MKYELELARSFMGTRGKKGWHPHILLSVMGIAVGVCFLVFALSIYDGYVSKIETIIFSFYPQITLQQRPPQEESRWDEEVLLEEEEEDNSCTRICSGQVVLEDNSDSPSRGKQQQGLDLALFPGLQAKLLDIPGVDRVEPIVFEDADFSCRFCAPGGAWITRQGPLRVLGVQPKASNCFVPEIERTITDRALLAGLKDDGTSAVLLSKELLDDFCKGLPPGARRQVKEVYLRGDGEEIPLKVLGTFKLGMHKVAENMLITSLDTAQRLFGMKGRATFAGISLADPYGAEKIAAQVKEAVRGDDLNSFHWMAVAADMFNSLSFYRKIVIIVLLMSLLITSFNIYTTLNIMILERKKQIGSLMAMGIKKRSLYMVFWVISQKEALTGIVAGVLSGALLGWLFGGYFNRSLQEFIPVQDAGTLLHPGTLVFILVFVCLICGLTAIAATRKGAGLDPVEALRSE